MTNSAANPTTSTNGTSNRGTDIVQIFLADEDGQSILSIDDGAQRQSLRVMIVNTSGKDLALKDLEKPFSTIYYHFRIDFRPGTLANQGEGVALTVKNEQGEKIEGWQILQTKDTFYLGLNQSAAAAAKSIANGKRLTFGFGNIGADPKGGSRGTRVEVQFANLQYADSQAAIGGIRLQYLNIVNHRGKKQIPLYAGFLGSNTILNDGSENELTLSIQSLPRQNLPLIIKPYSSDELENLQNVISDQTSFGKTAFDLLQKLTIFQDFLIDAMNTAIDVGIPDSTSLSRIHGDQNIIRFFANQTPQIIQHIRKIIKQSIEGIIKSGDINKFLDGQKTVKDLVWRDNQQSFLDAIFASDFPLINLFDRLRLDKPYILDLIPDNVANLKPYQVIREVNNLTKKSEISDALVNGFELIDQDDLRVILAGLNKINLQPTEAALEKLNLIGFDDAKSLETSVLGFKGIKSGDKLDLATANDALDESVTIRISFDVATTDNGSKHWALVEKTNADEIQVKFAQEQENWIFGGRINQGITPQWSFICKKPLQITDRQEILRLSIKDLKTQLLSGYANLYVHYKNFPGYWDGFITVPIHKGPLVYRECEDTNKVKIGCVGIGTDEPKAKLHVKSSSGVVGLKVEGDAEITGNFSAGKLSMGELGIGTIDVGDNKLKVQGNTAIAGNLTVTNGRLGIGTTNLDREPLVIRAQGTQQGLIAFEDLSGNRKWHIEQNFGGNTPGLNFVETNVQDFRLFIKQGGNVGIGTGDPKAKLHVNGAISAGASEIISSSDHLKLIRRSSETTGGAKIFLELVQNASTSAPEVRPCIRFHHGNKFWQRIEGGSDGFHFRTGDPGSGTYVSVNTGSMKVNGSLQVTDMSYGDRKNVQWDESSKQFYQDNSSRKHKENIISLDDEFFRILQVEPKTYTRPGNPHIWEVGYIAEDFDELGLNKLVYYEADGSPGAIHYDKISMYLIEVVKRLHQKVDDYEKRINQLEKMVDLTD